mgnify:CR=1 FL=1
MRSRNTWDVLFRTIGFSPPHHSPLEAPCRSNDGTSRPVVFAATVRYAAREILELRVSLAVSHFWDRSTLVSKADGV